VIKVGRKGTRPAGRTVGAAGAALVTGAAALTAVLTATPAVAAASSPTCSGSLGTPGAFNEFVDGSSTRTSVDSTGRVAVGGTANFTNFGIGSSLPANSSRLDLIVGGQLDANGGQIAEGSGTYGQSGGTVTSFGTPNGTLTQANPPFSFSSTFSTLQTSSTSWAGQPDTSGDSITFNDYGGSFNHLILVGTNSTQDVFDITTTQLQEANEVDIQFPSGATALVNVSGTSYSSSGLSDISFWNGSSYTQVGDSDSGSAAGLRDDTLWNFPNATTMSIGQSGGWDASILAPAAAMNFAGSQTNGNLIVASLTGQGESHDYLFEGTCLPSTSGTGLPVGAVGGLGLTAVMSAVFVVKLRRPRVVHRPAVAA
jgi:choice-of-anchor A domain-containing protein